MLQIFDQTCVQILQVPGGFAAVFQEGDVGHIKPRFRLVSVKEDTARDIDRAEFQRLKFGGRFDALEPQIDSYLLTICKPIGKNASFMVRQDGTAMVLDLQGRPAAQGNFRFEDTPPFDVAVSGHTVWASYPRKNAVIRYDLTTLRQELRVGGENSKVLRAPAGLWLQDRQLYLCNAEENRILILDTAQFTVQEYLSFPDPVYQFLKIEGYGIVRLASGVYRI